MTWLDLVLAAVIVLSALYSLFRGFVKEILSLAAWILSFWLASQYSYRVAAWLRPYIHYEEVLYLAAFVLCFVAVLVVLAVVNGGVARLVRHSRLGGLDRTLGVLFGALRGVLIVTLLVVVVKVTPLAESDAWRGSIMVGPLTALAEWATQGMQGGPGALRL